MEKLSLRFRLFGFPVVIEPTFLFLFFLIWFNNRDLGISAEFTFWILISVLIHEFGHAFMGRFFGMESKIKMHFMGGLTEWTDKTKDPSNLQFVLIALAGPIAGFLFGALIVGVWTWTGFVPHYFLPADMAYLVLLYINFAWGLANLLPMFPLDGGQVLYYLLREKKAWDATKISSVTSLIIAAGLMLWAFSAGQNWIGFLLIWILMINGQRLQVPKASAELESVIREVNKHRLARNYRSAYEGACKIIRESKSDSYRRWAYEMAAVMLFQIDDPALTEGFANEFKNFQDYSAAITFEVKRVREGDAPALAYVESMSRAQPTQSLVTLFLQQLAKTGQITQMRTEMAKYQSSKWFSELSARLQQYLFQIEEYNVANELAEELMRSKPDPNIAYNIACGYAKLGNKYATLSWLKKAVDLGFRNFSHMASDKDLNLVWEEMEFSELLARAKSGL